MSYHMLDTIRYLADAAESTYIKILRVNLTDDTFEVVKEDKKVEDGLSGQVGSISAYFSEFAERGLVYRDDEVDFIRYTNMEYIREFFRMHHHKNTYWVMYRRKTTTGYHWTTMEMMPDEFYTNENQTVYLLVKDINIAAKEQSVNIREAFSALCENFDSIYFVDLKTEEVTAYRYIDTGIPEYNDYIRGNPDYSEVMSKYIGRTVMPEDRNNVRRLTDLNFVKDHLERNQSLSGEFRVVISGQVHWYRIKFARVSSESSLRHIAIGLSDICDEKRMETDFYRDGKSILLVEENRNALDTLSAILEGEYPIIPVSDGRKALDILHEKHEEIAVIITDLHMPVMDGFELLEQVQSARELRAIPVIIATELNDNEGRAQCLAMGAADCVAKPYSPPIIKKRVEFMMKYREATNMLNLVERDALTGLYTKEFFYKHAESIMRSNPHKRYAAVVSDIEHFKVYNERHGVQAGDKLLKDIAKYGKDLIPGMVLSGRIGGDIFAGLLEDKGLFEWNYDGIVGALDGKIEGAYTDGTVIKNGVYLIDEQLPISISCDRAKVALDSIKGKYRVNVAAYDDDLRRRLNTMQVLTEHAEAGMENREFKVFYQPKHDLRTEQTGGAEALVRWIHPKLGFISPGDFIPLFEQNGFIVRLDEYVLDSVCRQLRDWMDCGRKVVPVSVNISRLDFEIEDLAEQIIAIIDKYELPHELIHIEITESSYSNSPERITQTISRLRKSGIKIELDDFGTGYSSITALNSLDLDIVKLDMSIIRGDVPDAERNVLDFIMQLTRMLELKTVQEGVETAEQVERVRSLGCDYVQGYYYSKPLPADEFEKYLNP